MLPPGHPLYNVVIENLGDPEPQLNVDEIKRRMQVRMREAGIRGPVVDALIDALAEQTAEQIKTVKEAIKQGFLSFPKTDSIACENCDYDLDDHFEDEFDNEPTNPGYPPPQTVSPTGDLDLKNPPGGYRMVGVDYGYETIPPPYPRFAKSVRLRDCYMCGTRTHLRFQRSPAPEDSLSCCVHCARANLNLSDKDLGHLDEIAKSPFGSNIP